VLRHQLIPPPERYGRLHLGHALNNTLQDILAARTA
jgi:valyl-tRNA synthetase